MQWTIPAGNSSVNKGNSALLLKCPGSEGWWFDTLSDKWYPHTGVVMYKYLPSIAQFGPLSNVRYLLGLPAQQPSIENKTTCVVVAAPVVMSCWSLIIDPDDRSRWQILMTDTDDRSWWQILMTDDSETLYCKQLGCRSDEVAWLKIAELQPRIGY